MEKGVFVKDITANAQVNGIFAIRNATLSESRNGNFWKLELFDRTGSIAAMIWFPLSQKFENLEAGMFAAINAQATVWREKLQLNIRNLIPLESGEELNMLDFLPSSPWDIDEMEEKLLEAARSEFSYAPWRKLIFGVLENEAIRYDFRQFPAARSIHQAYAGGLLEHSLAVFLICQRYCDLYTFLDRQTLLCAAILHDIGKTREFTGGLFNDYTTSGSLAGHIFLGLELLAPYITASGLPQYLKEHFTHLILSHHGQREFGAPVLPQTPEAFALHTADLADARLSQCRELFIATGQEKGGWSARQASLDRRLFNPLQTPQAPFSNSANEIRAETDVQWSLLPDMNAPLRTPLTGKDKE